MITGGADGAVHALQVRTGKSVWTYHCASGVINPSPVVDGSLVYISHGEENPEGGGLGRVVCLDASKVTAGKPKLVWEFRRGVRFGLASLALANGRLYIPDDFAKLYCFNAKTGKVLWKYNYGKIARGAPLIADGKVYIGATDAKFSIIKLDGNKEPDESKTFTVHFRNKPGASGFVEMNSTPSVADGRVYLSTRDEIYCIAKEGAKPNPGTANMAAHGMEGPPGPLAQVQVRPADVVAKPGETLTFTVKGFDAKGVPVKESIGSVAWSLPNPPPPKAPPAKTGAPPKKPASPPPLDGTIENGKVIVGKKPAQQGVVEAKVGSLTSLARVRVAPGVPYHQDFEHLPLGSVPAGWVNTAGKYSVVEVTGPDGKKSKALFKRNNSARPPLARAIAYMTMPEATGYTIQADVMGVEVREKLPDAGVVANRYTCYLDSKTNVDGKCLFHLISWEALPRVNVEVPFDWQSGTWYCVKMTVDVHAKDGVVKCKVWERGKQEPEKWTIEFTDPMPNRNGSAGLYGYIQNAETGTTGSEAYFDNVAITPNNKK